MSRSKTSINPVMRPQIRSFDWASTSIGSPEFWPASLHTVLDLALDTEFAMMIMWGPDLIQLYNDGYIPILGDKHPRSIGQRAQDCWQDIWTQVGPLLLGVYERGDPVYFENLQLPMTRNGGVEQAYFTFSYSPLRVGTTIGGLICVVDETTTHVLRERELRANEERFRTIAASMPHIVLEGDRSGAVTFLSEAYGAFTGQTSAFGLGTGWTAAIHSDDLAPAMRRWQAAIATGAPFIDQFRYRRADGTFRWHSAHALSQRDADGTIVRWTGTLTDIHDTRRAVEEREILSEASRLLAESLDLKTTLQNIAQLTVPRFADWCQIDLRTPTGQIQTVAIAHRDERKHELAQQFVGRIHLDPDFHTGNAFTIRTGLSDVVEELPPLTLHTAVDDDSEARVYSILGTRSFACIPLVAQGETLGAIGAVFGDSGRRYTRDDLPVLEELGRRAGLAVQNAKQFERQHRVAESFQRASLPMRLPDVRGLKFDAVYLPGSNEAQVGGDWYDAVRLLDGRVVISIGDVSGSGLHAAVRMGNMRQIIRGIAQVHADPALMLDAADRALRLEHPDEFVTAFVGVLDPISMTFSYASAGHPPPMLRYADGRVELLSDGGLPLGLRQGRNAASGKTIDLTGASALVLYTDGLSESAHEPLSGEKKLHDVVAAGAVLSAEHPALALKQAFLDGAVARDDIAILVVSIAITEQASESPSFRRWYFDVADAAAAQSARREFSEALRARGAAPEDVFTAEVVFGELVGNVMRYALGPVEVSVDLSSFAPVLHVLDRGPGFRHIALLPPDLYSESGRGLFLVSTLTDDFHVSKRLNGGSHARAVVALGRARLGIPEGPANTPLLGEILGAS
jgi:PAS domain S-box-containing protein